MSTIDELQHEFAELEHQWFIDRSSDRAPTAEQMDRVMKLAKDALTLAEAESEDLGPDLEEIRTEIKHGIEDILANSEPWKEVMGKINDIVDRETTW